MIRDAHACARSTMFILRAPQSALAVAATLLLAACSQSALNDYNLGVDAIERGDSTAALSHFDAAVRASPGDSDARANYGVTLLATGHTHEALTQLEAAADLAPEDPVIRVNLAEAHKAAGNFSAARSEYENALRRNSGM